MFLRKLLNNYFLNKISTDYMPLNITTAVANSKGLTLMPTYGLNVYSMLKHNTVVITTKSLEKIESKLLYYMHNVEFRHSPLTKRVA